LKNRIEFSKLEIVTVIIVMLILIGVILISNYSPYPDQVPESIKESERTYECNYHTISLNTHISFEYENETYDVTGKIITFFTDPLKLTKNGKTVGYASDKYHIVNQDDHAIYIDDKFEVDVYGNFDVIGNSYKLYDENGNQIGYAEFNYFCTAGGIFDMKNNCIATYKKPMFFNDYTVNIYDNNICSDKGLLMVIASYVSDYKADEQVKKNNNHND